MSNQDITQTILHERESRYGRFEDHAYISQQLKKTSNLFTHTVHGKNLNQHLSASQLEALDMIYHKIGRILNGDPNYEDSWRDIAGYATLVADELLDKEQ